MTGRITQLGLSRWTDTGGCYRTLQRFFHSQIDWTQVQGLFFQHYLLRSDTVYVLAGDESSVRKSGKKRYGIGWFFSSILHTPLPGLAFVSIALIEVAKRRAYPLSTKQVIRSEEEKEQTRKRKQTQKDQPKPDAPKRPRGRPKGSPNKNKADGTLSPKLPRIRAQGQEGMKLIREKLAVAYFVLDGHFGHAFATAMGRQRGLPLISKMPHKVLVSRQS